MPIPPKLYAVPTAPLAAAAPGPRSPWSSARPPCRSFFSLPPLLLAQSLRNLEHQNFGFEHKERFVAWINPTLSTLKPEQMESPLPPDQRRLLSIPGVRSVTEATYAPMTGDSWNEGIRILGTPRAPIPRRTPVPAGPASPPVSSIPSAPKSSSATPSLKTTPPPPATSPLSTRPSSTASSKTRTPSASTSARTGSSTPAPSRSSGSSAISAT